MIAGSAPQVAPVAASSPHVPAATAGWAIGRHQVVGELGRGGMGAVYRAYDPTLGRQVAVKVLLSRGAVPQDALERFVREARSTARLRHPGIVAVHEVGNHQGQLYFVMELIEGETLSARFTAGLRRDEALDIVRRVAEAVDYAHREGVVHRDLKPQNIMVDRGGTPRIMDFGLALDVEDVERLTQTGFTVGTPSYMAPEQATEEREQLPAVDVWALGALLYRVVCGHPPFVAPTAVSILKKVICDDPVPPREIQPWCPVVLESLILRCLGKEPYDRPTAAEVAAALPQFIEPAGRAGKVAPRDETKETPARTRPSRRNLSVTAKRALAARSTQQRRRSPVGLMIAGVVSFAVVMGAVLLTFGPRGDRRERRRTARAGPQPPPTAVAPEPAPAPAPEPREPAPEPEEPEPAGGDREPVAAPEPETEVIAGPEPSELAPAVVKEVAALRFGAGGEVVADGIVLTVSEVVAPRGKPFVVLGATPDAGTGRVESSVTGVFEVKRASERVELRILHGAPRVGKNRPRGVTIDVEVDGAKVAEGFVVGKDRQTLTLDITEQARTLGPHTVKIIYVPSRLRSVYWLREITIEY